MSAPYTSRKGNRVYVRKFDHDGAKRRYEAGETISSLAAEYGVSEAAVWYVVSEAGRRSARKAQERLKGAAHCQRCGSPMSKGSFYGGSRLCRSCAHDDLATSVGDGVLQCFGCKKWKPDEDFPLGHTKGRTRRRGRHSLCRTCQTTARRAYRERNKVPCIGCGKLVLRPNEKRTHGSPWPRCSSCARKGITP